MSVTIFTQSYWDPLIIANHVTKLLPLNLINCKKCHQMFCLPFHVQEHVAGIKFKYFS